MRPPAECLQFKVTRVEELVKAWCGAGVNGPERTRELVGKIGPQSRPVSGRDGADLDYRLGVLKLKFMEGFEFLQVTVRQAEPMAALRQDDLQVLTNVKLSDPFAVCRDVHSAGAVDLEGPYIRRIEQQHLCFGRSAGRERQFRRGQRYLVLD